MGTILEIPRVYTIARGNTTDSLLKLLLDIGECLTPLFFLSDFSGALSLMVSRVGTISATAFRDAHFAQDVRFADMAVCNDTLSGSHVTNSKLPESSMHENLKLVTYRNLGHETEQTTRQIPEKAILREHFPRRCYRECKQVCHMMR